MKRLLKFVIPFAGLVLALILTQAISVGAQRRISRQHRMKAGLTGQICRYPIATWVGIRLVGRSI